MSLVFDVDGDRNIKCGEVDKMDFFDEYNGMNASKIKK